jgi:hypothetical protein
LGGCAIAHDDPSYSFGGGWGGIAEFTVGQCPIPVIALAAAASRDFGVSSLPVCVVALASLHTSVVTSIVFGMLDSIKTFASTFNHDYNTLAADAVSGHRLSIRS